MQKAPPFFIAFEKSILEGYPYPDRFMLTHGDTPHPLSALAAKQLQAYLDTQEEWSHNFGLSHDEAPVVGKMFGVLVVEFENEPGYLAAFSGKLAGGNHHSGFVPPVFDTLAENGFLHRGMSEISRMNEEIKAMHPLEHKEQILTLKILRRNYSVSLQQEIFDHYHFLNRAGELKSANDLFSKAGYRNPPAGAGECAAPKLLQYAFQHHMKPLALAEFWWGLSPKSESWKHGHFYPCCREKCAPILAHMLSGIND
jgi:tRNA pseudouridine32 synthase/23S rRNA pseudouridine746 synthase